MTASEELVKFQGRLSKWRAKWCELYDAKALAKSLDAELQEMERPLLEEIAAAGGVLKTLDGKTVSVRTQEWVGVEYEGVETKPEGYVRACEALERAGMEQYILGPRFNVQSLSARVREMIRNQEPIPPEFEGALKISEKVTLTTRRH